MAKRYIKLYEQIVNWEWFTHPNTLALFIYLLCKANYKDVTFQGKKVKRGQLITSLPKIATGTGLSIRQTRTALEHLKSTNEVTDESSNQYRIITIVKYDDYQSSTDELTGNRQAIDRRVDRQSTDEATPSIEYIEYIEPIERSINGSNIKNNNNNHQSKRFTKPTIDEVRKYCIERKNWVDWNEFYAFYESNGWKAGRNPMKDWKAAVRYWEPKAKAEAQRKGLI